LHLKSHGLKVVGYQVAKLGVVVDDEQAHHTKMKAFWPSATFLTQS
jgi:hypothetical protein